jgi:glutathione peroxidase
MPFTARLACSIAALVAVGGLLRLVEADEKPTKNLVETAIAAGGFKTLVKALGDADLAKTLEGEGPFTVFAPTDEAFARLPDGTLAALTKDKPKLRALLARHVVAGRHDAKELSGMTSLKPLEGDALRLDAADGLTVNGAKVTRADVAAKNGVIHVIDAVLTGAAAEATPDSLYGLAATTLEGKPLALSEFKGKVTLVVNVASECGFTPQYTALQALHAELAPRGFSVLGFPSNEFGGQEPGDAGEIRTFCETKYHVTFPLFSKVVTKPGEGQSPIYAFLTKGREAPSWNFCKYLVGKDGQVVGFFASAVKPGDADLRKAIEAALK